MLIGVMVTYNDYPLIVECVESIYPRVDGIIAVDGRFLDFPGDEDFSTDGTIEYLESIDKVQVIYAPSLTEVDKRNLYLVGDVGDWYLMMDGDEVWTGSLEIPESDVGVVYCRRDRDGRKYRRAKVFRHVEGIHYEGRHNWLRDSEGNMFVLGDRTGKGYSWSMMNGAMVVHHDVKSRGWQSKKTAYYAILRERESKIKEHL